MVRTRSDCSGVRIGTKASFKRPASSSSSSSGKSSKRSGGCSGNRYCPRETPAWQKEITNFFSSPNKGQTSSSAGEGSSGSSTTDEGTTDSNEQ